MRAIHKRLSDQGSTALRGKKWHDHSHKWHKTCHNRHIRRDGRRECREGCE